MRELLPTLEDRLAMRGFRPRSATDLLDPIHAVNLAALAAMPRSAAEQIEAMRNSVHVAVFHAKEGVWEDRGVTPNLRTTVGLDWEADILGGILGIGDNTASGSGATSLTKAGAGWASDAYKGMQVWADNSTNAPVFGNIGTNSGTVLTVDQWWNGDDTTGTTPSSTCHFCIKNMGPARFVGITTDAGAASASDTTLASEETANGLGRKLASFAHTATVASYTQTVTFTYTTTGAKVIAKAGTFTAGTVTAGGIMVFETLLNATATVNASGDSITLTWTVNI